MLFVTARCLMVFKWSPPVCPALAFGREKSFLLCECVWLQLYQSYNIKYWRELCWWSLRQFIQIWKPAVLSQSHCHHILWLNATPSALCLMEPELSLESNDQSRAMNLLYLWAWAWFKHILGSDKDSTVYKGPSFVFQQHAAWICNA